MAKPFYAEVTDGRYSFGELIDPNDWSHDDKVDITTPRWRPIPWTKDVAGAFDGHFLYGWLENISQSDHVPYFLAVPSGDILVRFGWLPRRPGAA